MANFKTHASFGIVLGTVAAAAATTYAIISDATLAVWIFIAVVAGSFMPDLDSDGGAPFRILINAFALLTAVIIFLFIMNQPVSEFRYLVFLPIGSFIIIKFIVGSILKKFTHHRGIFHSIPGALICSFLTILVADIFSFSQWQKVVIGAGVFIGYIGHLVLDEFYAAVTLNGPFLRTKKSFGNALKFGSRSKVATIAAYVFLAYLSYKVAPLLENVKWRM